MIQYKYDAMGNLIETNDNGYKVEIHYDETGNKGWMDDPADGRADRIKLRFPRCLNVRLVRPTSENVFRDNRLNSV